MLCPKCQHEQDDSSTECARCGVIFAKYHKYQQAIKEAEAARARKPEGLLINMHGWNNSLYFYGRALVFAGLAIWGWQFISASLDSDYALNSFMHHINLPFHETGHIIFRPFGQFMMSLGGSLGQLLMPLVCLAVLLLKTRDAFGSAVCAWWFGQNFIDMAPYINDARSLTMPLVGGNVGHSSPYGFHDWEYILTESGLIDHDHSLAVLAHGFGAVVMVAGLVWAGYLLVRQYGYLQENRPGKPHRG